MTMKKQGSKTTDDAGLMKATAVAIGEAAGTLAALATPARAYDPAAPRSAKNAGRFVKKNKSRLPRREKKRLAKQAK